MNYWEALEYLETSIIYGIAPGLQRISRLAEELGNPQLCYPAVHVTGTNGKTSTARMTASILSSLGLKVGLYTSPHLEKVNERIAIDSHAIGDESFSELLSKIVSQIEKANRASEEKLTYFEILTALAFLYFQERSVDCAVVEVGMGGRWDATNVVASRVAVITNVELDHTDYLGDSLEAIAREKVGIIKPGIQVISGEQKPKIIRIIEEASREASAQLKLWGRDFDFSWEEGVFNVKGLYQNYGKLSLALPGNHQVRNASLAIAAAEAYQGRALPEAGLQKVLLAVENPGRLEVVARDPLVVLDGAHNPHGAAVLSQEIEVFDYEKLILVIAVLRDKDVEGMLKHLCPISSRVIVAENTNSRSLSASELAERVRGHTENVQAAVNVPSAIRMAMGQAGLKDLVLITGSLYTVGEARAFLRKARNQISKSKNEK